MGFSQIHKIFWLKPSLSELIIYHGLKAVVIENKQIEDFSPKINRTIRLLVKKKLKPRQILKGTTDIPTTEWQCNASSIAIGMAEPNIEANYRKVYLIDTETKNRINHPTPAYPRQGMLSLFHENGQLGSRF